MITGVLMVFAVLVLLFARVFQPITILSALPLSIGGAVAGADCSSGFPLSLPVVIGFLMLMGIVAKNSILLVDFAIEEMRAGKDRLTALLEAGHKRARPIVMTTVAMVAGMLPVAIGMGGDAAFRAPMAVAVIGGLITSTALTLVIVPAAFTLIDDVERWLAPKFRARAHRAADSARTQRRHDRLPEANAERGGFRQAYRPPPPRRRRRPRAPPGGCGCCRTFRSASSTDSRACSAGWRSASCRTARRWCTGALRRPFRSSPSASCARSCVATTSASRRCWSRSSSPRRSRPWTSALACAS